MITPVQEHVVSIIFALDMVGNIIRTCKVSPFHASTVALVLNFRILRAS